jgi:hypothetical protein
MNSTQPETPFRPKEAIAHFRMDEILAPITLLAVVVPALYLLLSPENRKNQSAEKNSPEQSPRRSLSLTLAKKGG